MSFAVDVTHSAETCRCRFAVHIALLTMWCASHTHHLLQQLLLQALLACKLNLLPFKLALCLLSEMYKHLKWDSALYVMILSTIHIVAARVRCTKMLRLLQHGAAPKTLTCLLSSISTSELSATSAEGGVTSAGHQPQLLLLASKLCFVCDHLVLSLESAYCEPCKHVCL